MTQHEKILTVLQNARGEWVNGRVFLRDLYLSQYHTRIHELKKKGYNIEPSKFKDEFGFVSYRLLTEPKQKRLI